MIVGARCQDEFGREEASRYLIIPVREAEILDDWHAMGMRGTGSFSLMLRDVFVPEHRTVTIADIIAGTPPGCHVHPDYAVLRAARYFLVPSSCRRSASRWPGALWSWCRPRCVAEACRYPMRACCGLARPLR